MGIFSKNNNQIVINGESIGVSGNNISIVNDSIYVDGKLVKDKISGITEIKFIGDLANLTSNASRG